ncbi:MAG TPA: GNAT family N-acetyltransferase [Rhizomicrobium sp.]|nr:GNAT family N-acetyltransferase [Rhizomicrobium sp.]
MSAAVPALTTARLTLRPLALSDAAQIQKTFPQWEIVKYLTTAVPWPYPEDGALTFIRDMALPAVARGEAWHWTIRRNEEPERLIGLISLMDKPRDNRGFWLDPAFQKQGFMAEASDAVTDYWFDVLGKTVMHIPKAAENLASRRISERSGMRVVDLIERDYVCGRLPAEVWEITREEWHARRRN